MSWQILPYLVPYLISLAISAGVGLYAWHRRELTGAAAYAWVALSQASWTLGYIFELASPSLEGKIFWDNIQWVAGVGWFFAFLAFAFQYTGRRLTHSTRIWGLLAIVPTILLVLVFTDDLHGWVRPTAWLVAGEPFSALVYDFTAPVWIWAIYGYGLSFAGMYSLVTRYIRPHHLYRAQVGTIIVGTLTPLVGTILTLAGITFTFHRDTTPLTFAAGSLIVAWGLFRYRLFDVVPVARHAVVESMSDAVVVLDAQNRLIDLNPAAQEIIGHTASEVIGQPAAQVYSNWSDLVEQYRDVEEAHAEIAVETGEGQGHFNLSLSPLRDRRGRLTGRVIVVRDITERKEAEEALQKSEESYRSLVTNIPDVVWTTDQTGRTIFISPNVKKVYGYTSEEIYQAGDELWLGRIHPDDDARIREAYRSLFARTAMYDVEYRIQHKDGHWIWLHDRAIATYEKDGVTYADGVFSDITARKRAEDALQRAHDELERRVEERTAELAKANADLRAVIAERKQAEEALRESEEQYRDLVENLNDVIYTVDRNGTITYVSPAVESFIGYRASEVIGRPFAAFIYQEDLQRLRQGMERLLTGHPIEPGESRILNKSGEIRWMHISSRPILEEKRVVGLQGVLMDITERKQAEESLRMYTERLRILHEIDQGILAAQSPKAIAQAAVSRIRQLIPCQRAGVVLINAETGEAEIVAFDAAIESQITEDTHIQLDRLEDVVEELRQGRVAVFEDLQSRGELFEILYAEGVRSSVSAPLMFKGELIGALTFWLTDRDGFAPEHVVGARQVADQLAIAIEQARLHEQVQHHAEELEQRVADRTRELSALYDVSAVASEALDPQTTLERVLERVLLAMGSNMGEIHLLDEAGETVHLAIHRGVPDAIVADMKAQQVGEGLLTEVIEHAEPRMVHDLTADPRVGFPVAGPLSWIGVPMRARGEPTGVLSVLKENDPSPFTEQDVELLTSIADQVGAVVESARLRQLAEQAAALEERQRLARDLHDSVTQSIYSLTLLAETGRRAANTGDLQNVVHYLARLGEVAQQALKEMRLLIYELRPPVLAKEGLVGALQQRLDAVEGRAGVETRLLAEQEGQLDASTEEALYRIALEALNNALKHAMATSVTVRIHIGSERSELEVSDNGRGFAPQAVGDEGGMGLPSMRERAERLGGVLTIRSAPGKGTRVKVAVGSQQPADSEHG